VGVCLTGPGHDFWEHLSDTSRGTCLRHKYCERSDAVRSKGAIAPFLFAAIGHPRRLDRVLQLTVPKLLDLSDWRVGAEGVPTPG
jgi:hypothetical protein